MTDGLCIPRGDLHVVRDKDTYVLFHPSSLAFFKVNQATAGLMDDYVGGMPVRELCQKYGATSEEMEGFFRGIGGQIDAALSEHRARMEEQEKKWREEIQERTGKEHPRILERLTLNISNDCNLRCRYCYADAVSHTVWTATTERWRSFSLGERRIQGLVKRPVLRYICPASGTGTLSISAEGGSVSLFYVYREARIQNGKCF